MDGQGADAGILEPFRQFHDDLAVLVPSESGFHRDRFADRLDDPFRDHHHLVRILHHSGAGTPAGDLADRAAEIDVDHVAAVASHQLAGGICHLRRPHHRVRIASVDLDPDRSFPVCRLQFVEGFPGVPYQTFRGDEFRVDHVGSLLPAYSSEGSVSHILHRRKQDGFLSEVEVSYFHIR